MESSLVKEARPPEPGKCSLLENFPEGAVPVGLVPGPAPFDHCQDGFMHDSSRGAWQSGP